MGEELLNLHDHDAVEVESVPRPLLQSGTGDLLEDLLQEMAEPDWARMEAPPQALHNVMAPKGNDAVNEVFTCHAAGCSTPTETGDDAYDYEALGADESWGGAVLCSYPPDGDENLDLSAKWTD